LPRFTKTISLLKEINEVLELGFADAAIAMTATSLSAPHVVCTQCKKIIDSGIEHLIDMTKEVADETGFKI